MAGILLLISTLLVVVYSASITIDCGTLDTVGVTPNCANYQILSIYGQPATNALNRFFSDCAFDGTVTNTITLTAGATCIVSNTLYTIPSNFAGTFTLTSSATNPATIQMLGPNNNFVFEQTYGTSIQDTAAYEFSNLIISANGAGAARFFQMYYGDVTMSNIQLVDSYFFGSIQPLYGSGLLLTAWGDFSGDFPRPFNISISDIEIYHNTINANELINGPVFSFGTGFSTEISTVSVTDQYMTNLVTMFYYSAEGSFDSASNSLSLSDVTYDNVHVTGESCGVLLCGGTTNGFSYSGEGFAMSNYEVDLSSIRVVNSFFSSSGVAALLSWYPNSDVISDSTISLSDSVFDGLSFSDIDAGFFFAAGIPSVTGNIFSNIVQTNTPDTSFLLGADNTYEFTATDNIFVDVNGFTVAPLFLGENSIDSLLSNNSFTNCIGPSNVPFTSRGGAIHLLGTATISDSTFSGNQANNGGAIYVEATEAYISNNVFDSNVAFVEKNYPFSVGFGGAILQNLVSFVTIVDCSFDGNNATGSGGAVAVINDRKLAVVGTTQNTENGGDTTFQSCSFDSNNAGVKGGALHFYARNVYVRDTNFTSNTALVGGAVGIDDINPFISSVVDFTNVRFVSNTADGTIQNSIFQYGGAVSTVRSARFYKALFDSNSCPTGAAGAIAFYKGGYIEESAFVNNQAGAEGGALWSLPIQLKNLTILSTSFERNSAGTDGGAAWIDNPIAVFSTCSFIENSGANGGALYFHDKGTVDGCGFTANVASADGGAVFSNGDTVVQGSRFENNVAVNGGAVACYSVPLGTVDFSLTLDGNNFLNNNASGMGGSVISTCNTWDTNSFFGPSTQDDASHGVVCPSDLRVLRQCEMTFTGSTFQDSGLEVPSPTATFDSISTGVTLNGVHGKTFEGHLSPESLSITGSDFDVFVLDVAAPTNVVKTTFKNGDYNQYSGPATFDECTVDAVVHTPGVLDFTFTFIKTEFTANGRLELQTNGVFRDVTGIEGAYFQLNASSTFIRVLFDCDSTVEVQSDLVIQDDSQIGILQALSGSVELIGSLSLGGENCDTSSEIAVGFFGGGNFVQLGGETVWSGGDITGTGTLEVIAGSFLFQSDGVITRAVSFGEDAVPTFNGDPAVNLGTHIEAKGGIILGDFSWIRVPPGAEGSITSYGPVHVGRESGMDCDYEGFGDMYFKIYDQIDYDSVYFTAGFWTANTTSVHAEDLRFEFTYEPTQGRPVADYGFEYDIIELSFVWPVATNGTSPFAGATYVYGDPPQPIGPDDSRCGYSTCYGPRVTTQRPGDGEPSTFLYLYASAPTQHISLVLLVLFLALSLF